MLINSSGRIINFDRVPMLAEHISIPPHIQVATAKHSYSFDEFGGGVCFHSPEALPDGATTLGSFLNSLAQNFFERGEKITPDSAVEHLSRLLASEEGRDPLLPGFELNRDDPMGAWFKFGELLRREYGIEQYAFVNWKDGPSSQ